MFVFLELPLFIETSEDVLGIERVLRLGLLELEPLLELPVLLLQLF